MTERTGGLGGWRDGRVGEWEEIRRKDWLLKQEGSILRLQTGGRPH